MSAQTAQVLGFPAKRAPQARPVAKLRVLDRVRELILDATLLRGDLNTVYCLAEVTDRETGCAKVEVMIIASRIGVSRSSVVRALKRLVDVGVIEREAQRKGRRCFATRYRLVLEGETPVSPLLAQIRPSPAHQRTEPGAPMHHS